jgi:hypothetical protein
VPYGERPFGVTILGVLALLVILAYLFIVWAAFTVLGNLNNPDLQKILLDSGGQFLADNAQAIFTVLALVYLVYAAVYALIGLGFLIGYPGAWKLGVGWGVFILATNIPMYLLAPSLTGLPSVIISTAITLGILLYIIRPEVRFHFKGPNPQAVGPQTPPFP